MILGGKIGGLWGKKVEVIGGLVLIAIGIRIVVEHLFFTCVSITSCSPLVPGTSGASPQDSPYFQKLFRCTLSLNLSLHF